jgi:hypothetical protein
MIRILAILAATLLVVGWLWLGSRYSELNQLVFAGASTIPDIPVSTELQWHPWNRAAFAEARTAEKPIFLYISPFWCGRCSRMELEALSSERVVDLINHSYLPIRVDPMRRPDVSLRYSLAAFPSCVILTPNGDMVGGGTYLPADSLYLLLDNIRNMWQISPETVERQAEKLRERFVAAADSLMPGSGSDLVLTKAQTAIETHFDSTYGGFGMQPKFPLPEINDFMLQVLDSEGKPVNMARLEQTLDAQLTLLDTVWGGFFRYAHFDNWTNPDHEKLLLDNAGLVLNYLHADVITGDSSYRAAVESTIGYCDRFLKSAQGWGFYSSQHAGLPTMVDHVEGDLYYHLNESGRLSLGIPPVDSNIYIDANAAAVRAYLQAGRVLNRREWHDYALKTLDEMAKQSLRFDGSVYHDVMNQQQAPAGLLADEIGLAQALLDAYETTGDVKYVEQAEAISSYLRAELFDTETGGLYDRVSSADDIGRLATPLKPFAINCEAVEMLMRLHHVTGEQSYREFAAGILIYLFRAPTSKADLRYCHLAESWLWYSRFPVKLVLVAEPEDDLRHFSNVIWNSFFPRLVLLQLRSDSKPIAVGDIQFIPASEPRLYVAQQSARSEPITDPTDLRLQVIEFLQELAAPKPPEQVSDSLDQP